MVITGITCKCGQRLQVAVASNVRNVDKVLKLVRCDNCARQDGRGDLRGVTIAPDRRWPWFMLPEQRR